MSFVASNLHQVHGEEFIDLEDIAAKFLLRCTARRTSSGVVTMMLSRAVREPKASCPVLTPPIARPDIRSVDREFFPERFLFLRSRPRAVLVQFDIGAGSNS